MCSTASASRTGTASRSAGRTPPAYNAFAELAIPMKEVTVHFPLFVITDRKPSMEMLESLLQPLRGEVEEGGRFDCWALGGRYTGQVIPYHLADTVTGGPDVGDDELAILRELADCWNVDLRPPVSKPSTGVDVARFDNIKTLEIVPDAILINGEWHRNG